MKKIVFLDIDGTLMAMDQTIPLSAIEACRSARKNGHLLYICSGRQSIEIPRQVREIGFDGLVSAGGASIETAGRNIFQAFMDRGTVIRIVDFFSARREAFALDLPDQKISTPALWALMERAFRSIKGKEAKGKDARKGGGGRGNANDTSCRPLAPASTNPYGPIGFVPSSATPSAGDKTMRRMVLWAYPERPRTDAGLSTPRPGSPKQDAEGCRVPATPPIPAQTSADTAANIVADMTMDKADDILSIVSNGVSRKKRNFYRDDVQKIIFVGRKGSFDELRDRFGGECEIFRGSIPLFGKESGEISPPGVHKGSAVEVVARYHGIPLSDTIAIGDSDNDRPMIERAGVGIAMGNADNELKALAAHVTTRLEEDGIMRAFQRFGLV